VQRRARSCCRTATRPARDRRDPDRHGRERLDGWSRRRPHPGPGRLDPGHAGSLIADQFVAGLAAAVDDAVKPDPNPDSPVYEHGALASGAYWTTGSRHFSPPPFVMVTAEIVAVDACPVSEIDVTVGLQLIATFAASGPSLDTTLKLTWGADSTWLPDRHFFFMTPIAPFVIRPRRYRTGERRDLGQAPSRSRASRRLARDDTSVTFLQHRSSTSRASWP